MSNLAESENPAVKASGALRKPGKRCFRRAGATGKVLAQLCSNFATAETPEGRSASASFGCLPGHAVRQLLKQCNCRASRYGWLLLFLAMQVHGVLPRARAYIAVCSACEKGEQPVRHLGLFPAMWLPPTFKRSRPMAVFTLWRCSGGCCAGARRGCLVVFLAMRFGLVCARRAVACCCGCRRCCQQAFLFP